MDMLMEKHGYIRIQDHTHHFVSVNDFDIRQQCFHSWHYMSADQICGHNYTHTHTHTHTVKEANPLTGTSTLDNKRNTVSMDTAP